MKQAAFLAITSNDIQPYLDYDHPLDCDHKQKFSRIMILLRWDGYFGFPGGEVDLDETPYEALKRELVEEINFDLTDELEPVDFLNNGALKTYLYHHQVSANEFESIVDNAKYAKHYKAETCGIINTTFI